MALSTATSSNFNAGYFSTGTTTTGSVTFGSNSKLYTTGSGGWSFVPSALGPGEWVCRQCSRRFYIVDDQPTIEKRIEQIDLTTFGSITRQYTTQEHIELYCSSCRP